MFESHTLCCIHIIIVTLSLLFSLGCFFLVLLFLLLFRVKSLLCTKCAEARHRDGHTVLPICLVGISRAHTILILFMLFNSGLLNLRLGTIARNAKGSAECDPCS